MQQPGYNVPHTQVRGEPMQSPEGVAAMLRLKAFGWGAQRIADEPVSLGRPSNATCARRLSALREPATHQIPR